MTDNPLNLFVSFNSHRYKAHVVPPRSHRSIYPPSSPEGDGGVEIRHRRRRLKIDRGGQPVSNES